MVLKYLLGIKLKCTETSLQPIPFLVGEPKVCLHTVVKNLKRAYQRRATECIEENEKNMGFSISLGVTNSMSNHNHRAMVIAHHAVTCSVT